MNIEAVKIEKPDELNVILGQSHFIKTVEDLEEALVGSVPGIKFGLAFCEASGPRLIRFAGNDDELAEIAKKNCMKVACGHFFIIALREAFPIHVMRAVRDVPEVCSIYAATANPLEVVVAETELGRGVMGVIDGEAPLGIEKPDQQEARKRFLRTIGYKQG